MPVNDLHYDFGVVEFIKDITEYLTDCHQDTESFPTMKETQKAQFELDKLQALRYEVNKYLVKIDHKYLPAIQEKLEDLETRFKSDELGFVISRSIESLVTKKEN